MKQKASSLRPVSSNSHAPARPSSGVEMLEFRRLMSMAPGYLEMASAPADYSPAESAGFQMHHQEFGGQSGFHPELADQRFRSLHEDRGDAMPPSRASMSLDAPAAGNMPMSMADRWESGRPAGQSMMAMEVFTFRSPDGFILGQAVLVGAPDQQSAPQTETAGSSAWTAHPDFRGPDNYRPDGNVPTDSPPGGDSTPSTPTGAAPGGTRLAGSGSHSSPATTRDNGVPSPDHSATTVAPPVPAPTILASGREQADSVISSRDAATLKSADLVVQTTADSHDASARAVVTESASIIPSARIIAIASDSMSNSVAVAPAESTAPAAPAESEAHAGFFHLASMAQTLAGPVELLGRVFAGAAPSVIPDGSSEMGSVSDLSVGQAAFLGLAPLRMLPGDEAGQAWRITAGVSLIVTAIGYWYCQTNPLQARKRAGVARTMILNARQDRDAAFPM